MTARGADFLRLLGEPLRRDAARLLKGARLASAAWFRDALAADVVAASGRVFPTLLALRPDGSFLSATCSCTARLTERTLCPHAAALVVTLVADREGKAPSERFEESLWYLACRDLAALGRPPDEAAMWCDLALPAPSAAATAKEKLLERVTKTPEEAALNDAGAVTHRQAWERSPWHALARGLLDLRGPGWDLAAECEAGRLVLRSPDGALRLVPARATVEELLRRGFFAERGFGPEEPPARIGVRVELAEAGELRLVPAVLVEVEGAERVEERAAAAERLFGDRLLLPDLRLFARVAPGGPFFAEPEASAQAALSFDESYVPSPFGVPLDRVTVVPAAEAPRFLDRHAGELSRMPPSLLAPALRDRPVVPRDATLVVTGERDGRFLGRVEYDACGVPLPHARLRVARRRGEALLPHAGRLVNAADLSLGWLDAAGDEELALAPLDVFRLRAYLPGALRIVGEGAEGAEAARRLEAREEEVPAPDPDALGAALWDFQRLGYAWLWSLRRSGFGGLLCDDMGLGKTHQAMALLAALAREKPESLSLVVAPTSVLPHWEEKLRRHLPSVPLALHHGDGRGALPASGVVVTSYGIARNDAERLARARFDLLVLDEAHVVKNRDTDTHRAVRALSSRCVVGLTGTPIENSPEDLKSLLDLAVPGYVPGEAEFRRAFLRPIEEGDARARERLARLVRPFVLRRTKAQVLTGLPEKIVDRRLCELSPEQRELYRETLASQGASLAERIERERTIPYLHVFALLSRLKQICNHPAMLEETPGALGGGRSGTPGALGGGRSGTPGALGGGRSGKWDLLEELLDECLASGLKVVVFSQYVKMLRLVEAHLAARAIGFATIKGETRDRGGEMARFRDDPGCRVFTASLRAAGLGIDLTPASVVVHYDRWWNRAREEQATDRVHRPGQTRGVQVLKLIAKGTIEERIDAMIERKGALAEDLVAADDPLLARQFTREELAELLAPLA